MLKPLKYQEQEDLAIQLLLAVPLQVPVGQEGAVPSHSQRFLLLLLLP